jgi:hypothetical protein
MNYITYTDTTLDFDTIISYIIEKEKEIISMPFEQRTLTEYPYNDLSIRWPLWNIFVTQEPAFHKVFILIKTAFKLYKEKFDVPKQPYWIQAWGNVSRKGNKIALHTQRNPFSGWVGINAENSDTIFYDEENTIIKNKNGQIVITSDDIPHETNIWQGEEPRITIAFDIVIKKWLNTQKTGIVIPFE